MVGHWFFDGKKCVFKCVKLLFVYIESSTKIDC